VTGVATPGLRLYLVEVNRSTDVTRLPTLAAAPHEAVRMVLSVEDVPVEAVTGVFEYPTCDYCTRIAQLWVRDNAMTPLCRGCASGQYTTAKAVKEATGELTVGTLTRLPSQQWMPQFVATADAWAEVIEKSWPVAATDAAAAGLDTSAWTMTRIHQRVPAFAMGEVGSFAWPSPDMAAGALAGMARVWQTMRRPD
jgi:hypothetical protein